MDRSKVSPIDWEHLNRSGSDRWRRFKLQACDGCVRTSPIYSRSLASSSTALLKIRSPVLEGSWKLSKSRGGSKARREARVRVFCTHCKLCVCILFPFPFFLYGESCRASPPSVVTEKECFHSGGCVRGVDPWISHLLWRWIPSKIPVLAWLYLFLYFPLHIFEGTSNAGHRANATSYSPPL